MARRHLLLYLKIFTDCIRSVRASFLIILLLSQMMLEMDRYSVVAISPRLPLSSSPKADKFGAYMERQPESTVAPLYDEVLFECGLNLVSDRIEWRFRPQKPRSNGVNGYTDYIYLNKVSVLHQNKNLTNQKK